MSTATDGFGTIITGIEEGGGGGGGGAVIYDPLSETNIRSNRVGEGNGTLQAGVVGVTYLGVGESETGIYEEGNYSTILGGQDNSISPPWSAIVGGQENNIEDEEAEHSFIGGGQENLIETGDHSVICGGEQNSIEEDHCFVGGGYGNQVEADFGSVVGGIGNKIQPDGGSVDFGAIGGGVDNAIQGGIGNSISGGAENRISTDGESEAGFSTIAGGITNEVNGYGNTVGGGEDNNVGPSGDVHHSTVGGGNSNNIQSDFGTIGGGDDHQLYANADYGVIPGGRENYVVQKYGQSSGVQAYAGHVAQRAFSAGQYVSGGDIQLSDFLYRGKTTGGVAEDILLGTGGYSSAPEAFAIPLLNDKSYLIQIDGVARSATQSKAQTLYYLVHTSGGVATTSTANLNELSIAGAPAGWQFSLVMNVLDAEFHFTVGLGNSDVTTVGASIRMTEVIQ